MAVADNSSFLRRFGVAEGGQEILPKIVWAVRSCWSEAQLQYSDMDEEGEPAQPCDGSPRHARAHSGAQKPCPSACCWLPIHLDIRQDAQDVGFPQITR
jgi:hypothetical protein